MMDLIAKNDVKAESKEKEYEYTHFKGHPQPPIDERLEQIKIFLADEDPDRCLGFSDKFSEIEDYVKYIQDEDLTCDKSLLHDVKVMAEVHRDWATRNQAGPPDVDLCNPLPLLQVSTRLVSAQEAERLEQEREALGLVTQMREDHAPFTVNREDDHGAFLRALSEDAYQNPDEVDVKTNLLFVETRAFAWARREPALIPVWLNATNGLQRKGRKIDDALPWYCQNDHPKPPNEPRPPVNEHLPDYLQRRADEINRLLRLDRLRTREQEYELRGLLERHELGTLRDYRERAERVVFEFDIFAKSVERKGIGPGDEEWDKRFSEAMVLKNKYEVRWKKWVKSFKRQGVQIMSSPPNGNEFRWPGVFFEREAEPYDPENELDFSVTQANAALLELRKLGFNAMLPEKKLLLIRILWHQLRHWQPEIFQEEMSQIRALYEGDELKTQSSRKMSEYFAEPIEATLELCVGFEIIRPGELDNKMKVEQGILYLNRPPLEERWVPYQDPAIPALAATSSSLNANQVKKEPRHRIDFTSKAEIRGIIRAAIELGLNLLASNQEQQRPKDHFRIVEIPPPYESPPDDVPLTLPLEAWKRPIEIDTFEFTKRLEKFRKSKDWEYQIARKKTKREIHIDKQRAPKNFRGPFTVADTEDLQNVLKKRHVRLAIVFHKMAEAERKFPRRLIQEMLVYVQEGLGLPAEQRRIGGHPFYDEKTHSSYLSEYEIALLEEIAGDSWDDISRPLKEVTSNMNSRQMADLEEFILDLEAEKDNIAFWVPELNEDGKPAELPEQVGYIRSLPSIQFVELGALLQTINTNRLKLANNSHIWSQSEAKRFLNILARARRIHFDDAENHVSKVPFNGHPENKYIESREAVDTAPGIYRNEMDHPEVRYNIEGKVGPPIVQPNKIEYLHKVAFQLGVEISDMLLRLANAPDNKEAFFDQQWQGMRDVFTIMDELTLEDFIQSDVPGKTPELIDADISLQTLAMDLLQVAPELAIDAGIKISIDDPYSMTDEEAGILLQMQLIEESSNNWESRFPENEHVWDFATPRVQVVEQKNFKGRTTYAKQRVRQYFSMRRYPLCVQSEASQILIKASGPIMDDEKIPQRITQPTRESGRRLVKAQPQAADDELVEIHRGGNGPPYFPFGETPYQAAYLSFRMHRDLEDIPEFAPRPARRFRNLLPSLPQLPTSIPLPDISRLWRAKEPVPYSLPKLPLDKNGQVWLPQNIDPEEADRLKIEMAKEAARNNKDIPSSLDPEILENYHSQEEIAQIRHAEAVEEQRQAAEEASQAVQDYTGSPPENLTPEQLQQACVALGMKNMYKPRLPPGPGPPPLPRRSIISRFLRRAPEFSASSRNSGRERDDTFALENSLNRPQFIYEHVNQNHGALPEIPAIFRTTRSTSPLKVGVKRTNSVQTGGEKAKRLRGGN